MEIAGGALFWVILVLIAGVLIESFIIHLAARFAGVSYATFGMAVKACLICTLLSFILGGVFALVPGPGPIIGFLISLCFTLLILKGIYRTGWGRALLIWALQVVVTIILAVAVGSLMGLALL